MKTLLLMRHAKARAEDSGADDHERSLTKRGKREAPMMGRLLSEEDLLPDLILSSSAKRCRKTADHVIEHCAYRGETRISGELYEAKEGKLREVLARLEDDVARVLVIGHNPGLEQLLLRLTGNYRPLAPGALAQVELAIGSWREWDDPTRGELKNLWQPRELEED